MSSLLDAILDTINKLKVDVSTLQTTNKARQNQIIELQAKNNQQDAIIGNLQAKDDRQDASIRDLRAKNKDLKSKHETQHKATKDLQVNNKEQQTKNTKLEKKNIRQDAVVNRLRNDLHKEEKVHKENIEEIRTVCTNYFIFLIAPLTNST